MYKLREKRLKDFYSNDDVMTTASPSTNVSVSTSYSHYSSSSNSGQQQMETEEEKPDQKRRNVDQTAQEDAVSEKIRRKSSERTKRYQMVLTEIEPAQQQPTVERVMTPDSLTEQPYVNGHQVTATTASTSASSYQLLKSSSSTREFQDGDMLTVVQVTETWRRINEGAGQQPVTQRVTLTKTLRKRLSDGLVLEENEDEVIDDIDDGPAAGGLTAVDIALRRSSIVASSPVVVPPVEEQQFAKRQVFQTEQDNISEPDSLDNFPLPVPSNDDDDSLEISELDCGSTATTATTTRMEESSSYSVQSPRTEEIPAPTAFTIQVEELTETIKSKPVGSKTAVVPAKTNAKRTDSAELRKTTTTTTSSSRTGLGGINRSAYSSPANKSSVTKSSSSSNKTASSSSSIPRLASTPTKKKSMEADESVTEFLQLEQESAEMLNGSAKRPAAAGRKTAELAMTPTTRLTSTTTQKVTPKMAVKTSSTTTTTTTKSTASKTTQPAIAKPSGIGKPTMIRTVETTRTVTVRGEEDKPWRMNNKAKPALTTTSSSRNSVRKDLHNNVMSVVEKYVETDGCAIHGSHPHIHEMEHDPSPVQQPEQEQQHIQRPKLLSVPAGRAEESPEGGHKSGTSSKLATAASPVLGSPSVVKKARSLFHSDSVEDNKPDASISKTRSSFESTASSSSSTLKRENTKLWEPAKSPSRETEPPARASLFTTSRRSPSPAKEQVAVVQQPVAEPVQQPSDQKEKVIEDIEDLPLLENMVNSVITFCIN